MFGVEKLTKLASENFVVWQLSGIQTWVCAFFGSLAYPNWAVDASTKVLVPAKAWMLDTALPAASNYFEAAMDVVGGVSSVTS